MSDGVGGAGFDGFDVVLVHAAATRTHLGKERTGPSQRIFPFLPRLPFRHLHAAAYRQESVLRPLATRAASATPPARSTPPAPSSSLSSFSSSLASGRRPAAASPLSELAASLNSSRSSAQNENFFNLLSVNRSLELLGFLRRSDRASSLSASYRPPTLTATRTPPPLASSLGGTPDTGGTQQRASTLATSKDLPFKMQRRHTTCPHADVCD